MLGTAWFKRRLRRLVRFEIARALEESNRCLETAVRFVCWNQVPGDYLEFGCHSGRSFTRAHGLYRAERGRVGRELTRGDREAFDAAAPRFFAFDSFEGLPEAANADHHPYLPGHWKAGGFATSKDDFSETLRRAGIPLDDVVIVAGWYEKTLTEHTKKSHGLKAASIVHIDCDYYESSLAALNFVSDLILDGTVVIFDDYNYFRGAPDLGERRAFSEWLAQHPEVAATELARSGFESVAFFLSVGRGEQGAPARSPRRS